MKSTTDRKKAFKTIDKDGSGIVEFKEWYKHFDSLLDSTNMNEQELLMMFQAYEGDSKGVNYEEYTSFMNDVFGKAEDFDLRPFVEEKINHYAQTIIDGKDRADDMAMGELHFYMALRRVLKGQARMADVGLMDAINDVMQEKGHISKDVTFYH